MILRKLFIIGIFISVFSAPALADRAPRSGTADARVKTLTYHENDVYRLRGYYGFTTVIEFSSKERIETISIGDSEAWQIIKPSRPNVLFVKPLEQNAETNMTVLTSKRIYTFEMSADKAASPKSGDLTFRLKFIYPEEEALELASIGSLPGDKFDPLANSPISDWNFDYSYSGAKKLRPTRAFDDGTFTYFQFKDFDTIPAVFTVDEQGNESIINFNIQGQYLVVNRVARQFTFRDGDTATCIFNDGFPKAVGAESAIVPIEVLEEKKVSSNVPIPPVKPDFEQIKQAQDEENSGSLLAFFTDSKPVSSKNMNQ